MALRDLLLSRAAGRGNHGNQATETSVTEKSFTIQSGNRGNVGNQHFGECHGDGAGKAPPTAKTTHATSYICGYLVTSVTRLKNQENSGNRANCPAVTAVTIPGGKARPDREHTTPQSAEGLVARLVRAGATVRAYDVKAGGASGTVEVSTGIPAELLRQVEARGWRIIPGGKPNPEAEHDSWLAGVPSAELRR